MTPNLQQRLSAPGPKRILALDGGGVRGVISIAFLEELESKLATQSGRGEAFRLSDYFDLIGGTSVGSMIATMLALGYSVTEVKDVFEREAPRIFRNPAFLPGLFGPKFNARGLARAIKKITADRTLGSPDLKTGLAIIAKRLDTGSPWVMTNNPRGKYYGDPTNDDTYIGNKHYSLFEIIRASTAAPFYFHPKKMRILEKKSYKERLKKLPRTERSRFKNNMHGIFVDGGVSPHNNPALQLFMLAGMKGYGFDWSYGADNLLLVSVGTGRHRVRFKGNWFTQLVSAFFATKSLQSVITDGQELALTWLQWMSHPRVPLNVNSEIGNLNGELLGLPGIAEPLMTFQRYDIGIDESDLDKYPDLRKKDIEFLQQFDEPENMELAQALAEKAAKEQVSADDFPAGFMLQMVDASEQDESTEPVLV